MTLPRKPGRYWGDGDFNALADAIEGVEGSMPITYVQNDPPVAPIPAGSTWVDADAVPAQAYLWDGTQWVDLSGPPGEQGPAGLDGLDGDNGLPGPAGTSSYTHIAYANSSDGVTGFSTSDAVNKLYIGMRVDAVEADSQTPSDYRWTLIKGQDGSQGIPGDPGADGLTPYFHTAWATSADGSTGFSTTVSTDKTYLGTYTDYVSADSETPGDYAWVKIQGPQGPAGADGSDGSNGADGARGAGNWHYQSSASSAPDASTFASQADAVTPGGNVYQDRVTIFNPGATVPWSVTKFWDGDSWEPMAQYLDGNLVVNGTIAGTALIAETLEVGSIKAGEITVDRLNLPYGDNLVPNPNSDATPPAAGWPAGAWEAVGLVSGAAYQGTYHRRIDAPSSATVKLQVTPWITVAEGEDLYAESMVTVSRDPSVNPCGRMVIAFRNAAGTEIGWLWDDPVAGDYNKVVASGAAPAAAATACLRYEVTGAAGFAYIDNMILQKGRKVGSVKTYTYAEDGAGNPTAGAKLDSSGTGLKAKNFHFGKYTQGELGFVLAAARFQVYTGSPLLTESINFVSISATTLGGQPCVYLDLYTPIAVSGSGELFYSLARQAYDIGNSPTGVFATVVGENISGGALEGVYVGFNAGTGAWLDPSTLAVPLIFHLTASQITY